MKHSLQPVLIKSKDSTSVYKSANIENAIALPKIQLNLQSMLLEECIICGKSTIGSTWQLSCGRQCFMERCRRWSYIPSTISK